MQRLSILIPAYNEAAYIGTLLNHILSVSTEQLNFEKEIIVIDDCSTDRTGEIARNFTEVQYFRQEHNQGKGAAIKLGIQKATGDWIIIQDADLEYDPNDYLHLLGALQPNTCVYGSRVLKQKQMREKSFFPGKHTQQGIGAWVAGIILSYWTFLVHGVFLTDTLTAYKLYPAALLKQITIKTHGFETDHELTAKIIKAGVHIVEVPIHYQPRTREEGKKIQMSDGFKAVWTILKYRFLK